MMPQTYARTLLLVLRSRLTERQLLRATGMSRNAYRRLMRLQPTHYWTVGMQGLLESLLTPEEATRIERIKHPPKEFTA